MEQIYKASREALKESLIKSGIIGLLLAWFATTLQSQHDQISTKGLWSLMFILTLFFGLLMFFMSTNIRNYEITLREMGISRLSYKGTFEYQIQWDKIDLMVFGEVVEYYRRWEYWFEGVEIHYRDQSGYAQKSVYKLEHLVDHKNLIEQLIHICEDKGIQYNLLEKSE